MIDFDKAGGLVAAEFLTVRSEMSNVPLVLSSSKPGWVPATPVSVTLTFWIIKIAATTLGETGRRRG